MPTDHVSEGVMGITVGFYIESKGRTHCRARGYSLDGREVLHNRIMILCYDDSWNTEF